MTVLFYSFPNPHPIICQWGSVMACFCEYSKWLKPGICHRPDLCYKWRSVQNTWTWYQGWGRFFWPWDHRPKASCTLQISLGCDILLRHSAQILIDLIAYIFQLPTLCRWSRSPKFEDSHCAFHHCPLWSEWGCSADNQINLPASLARATCNRMKAPFGIYAIEMMKLTDGVYTDGKVINTGPLWMESFLILVHHFTLIHPRVQAASGSVEVGQGQNILIINWVKNFTAVTQLLNFSLEAFIRQQRMQMGKYDDRMLDEIKKTWKSLRFEQFYLDLSNCTIKFMSMFILDLKKLRSLYPAQRSWRGGVLDSLCPSVHLSVRPSVRLSVCL